MPSPCLFILQNQKLKRIPFREICLLTSEGNYSKIMTKDETFTVKKGLGEMMKLLPENEFFRVHKCYIIAFAHIRFIECRYIKIGNSDIPIGDTFYPYFMQQLTIVA
ncbi:LytTR family transcriptional regulator [Flavihumibacter sediminis]|nr:LytTR family transcriptional regulator [Flavihumibacter sediminis]